MEKQSYIIYHNTRCSKSREALDILEKADIPGIQIRKYLDDPLTEKELKVLLKQLGIPAIELIRQDNDVYRESIQGKALTEAELLQLIASNPRIMQRPVISYKDKAVIGRPPEKIKELFS